MVTLTISADPLDEAMRERADALAEEARMGAEEARRRRLHLRHWQQHYDDEGRLYYYNEATGETRTERPTAPGSPARGYGYGYDGYDGGGGGGGGANLQLTNGGSAGPSHSSAPTFAAGAGGVEPLCCRLGMRLEIYGHRVLVMGLVRTADPTDIPTDTSTDRAGRGAGRGGSSGGGSGSSGGSGGGGRLRAGRAEAAGLRIGDQLLSVAGLPVDARTLASRLRLANYPLEVCVWRGATPNGEDDEDEDEDDEDGGGGGGGGYGEGGGGEGRRRRDKAWPVWNRCTVDEACDGAGVAAEKEEERAWQEQAEDEQRELRQIR
jgi:hypothetical protein